MYFVATAGVRRPYTVIIAKALKKVGLKKIKQSEEGKKYYSQHDLG